MYVWRSFSECGDLKLGGHRRSIEAVCRRCSLLFWPPVYIIFIDLIKMYVYSKTSYLGQLGARCVQHLPRTHSWQRAKPTGSKVK